MSVRQIEKLAEELEGESQELVTLIRGLDADKGESHLTNKKRERILLFLISTLTLVTLASRLIGKE